MYPIHTEKKPDFFIVGAPKCGTTALYKYLSQHPEIFMSRIKEPHFFGGDLTHIPREVSVRSLEAYLELFDGAGDEKRLGEASTGYLYSRVAAKEIRQFNPSARIIIMLRNPVDMMYSLHRHQVFSGFENIKDFRTALEAEEARKAGETLPPRPELVEGLFYRELASYSSQVRRYLEIFGAEPVHIIIFDDFVDHIDRTYRGTLAFLEVDQIFRPEFSVVNASRSMRSRALFNFIRKPPQRLRWLVREFTPQPLRFYLAKMVESFIIPVQQRQPMDIELRRRLCHEFTDEVKQLSELIGRDLTHWTRAKQIPPSP